MCDPTNCVYTLVAISHKGRIQVCQNSTTVLYHKSIQYCYTHVVQLNMHVRIYVEYMIPCQVYQQLYDSLQYTRAYSTLLHTCCSAETCGSLSGLTKLVSCFWSEAIRVVVFCLENKVEPKFMHQGRRRL